MASKEIHFSDSARNKLYEGIKQLSDAVKVTMGPKGFINHLYVNVMQVKKCRAYFPKTESLGNGENSG